MNDRFKFRAWNEQDSILYYDVEDTYDYLRGKPCPVPRSSFGCLLTDEDFVVEQCTGIKDENGKLIYEGDIVKYGIKTFIVVWSYNAWVAQTNEVELFLNEGFEVVGNIHENPELLEQSNDD